jgi:hypothetical protein
MAFIATFVTPEGVEATNCESKQRNTAREKEE